jgi:hypothetical protein
LELCVYQLVLSSQALMQWTSSWLRFLPT